MRKVMSVPEWVAVFIMLVGLNLGFYASIASTLATSKAIAGVGTSVGSATTSTQISETLSITAKSIGAATRLRAYADLGFWIWLLGIAMFIVSSRLIWNRALRELMGRLPERAAPSGADEK